MPKLEMLKFMERAQHGQFSRKFQDIGQHPE
jgi:hypothetical protein